jgi:hypothetical protein
MSTDTLKFDDLQVEFKVITMNKMQTGFSETGTDTTAEPINETTEKNKEGDFETSVETTSSEVTEGNFEPKYIESNFVKQLRNQIERVKEIIRYPSVAICHRDALDNIFTSIDSMVDSYPSISFKTISKQIINSIDYTHYQEKFKDEFKAFYSMNYNTKNVLKTSPLPKFEDRQLPSLKYTLQNFFDELEENIDLSMDKHNLTPFDREKIYNYFTLKDEIEDMLEELIVDVKNYEKAMVEYTHFLTQHVKNNVMPVLYVNHQIMSLQNVHSKNPKLKQSNYFNKELNEYFRKMY